MTLVALLSVTEALLRDELAPTLESEGRYRALLAANAVGLAGRALRVAPFLADEDAADPAAIRAGLHDDDAALHARLLADAVLRAWIADPAALTEAEREQLPPALRMV